VGPQGRSPDRLARSSVAISTELPGPLSPYTDYDIPAPGQITDHTRHWPRRRILREDYRNEGRHNSK